MSEPKASQVSTFAQNAFPCEMLRIFRRGKADVEEEEAVSGRGGRSGVV